MPTTDLQPKFQIYNALSKRIEFFRPLRPPLVSLYVCGPTVYSEVHLGNIRTFLSFDILQRFLSHIGYEVLYVRNITDVGHLTEESEDKVEQAARRQQISPSVLTEYYIRHFHEAMAAFGIRAPQLEPRATAHVYEQIQLITRLLEAGYAYEVSGSVYFDLKAYEKNYSYGQLSGRRTEELYAQTRSLEGQTEKKHTLDFALWKRAAPDRLMQWDSPWGKGVPGWHLECSAMSLKYLGHTFDIHGGGVDLKFPHHECEIAQSVAAYGQSPAKYWMYTNMLTVEGEKMSKSAGNILTYKNLTEAEHELLRLPYAPMVLRFLMLQTHYSSPLDYSSEAIEAAHRGYLRLMNGLRLLHDMQFIEDGKQEDKAQQAEITANCKACDTAMCQNLNTASTLAALFSLLKKINALHSRQLSFSSIGKAYFEQLKCTYVNYVEEILYLKPPTPPEQQLLKGILSIYQSAKRNQQYTLVDDIRKQLRRAGISVQDTAKGEVAWSYAE